MPTYAIGDIQGCFTPLQRLLAKINFDKNNDTLWLTGDLVNRGNESLDVLRFCRDLGEKCKVVLGNHDLHLLAIYHKVRSVNEYDTFHDVLAAHDVDALMQWLLTRPLLVADDARKIVMTHAGIAPCWTIAQTKQHAHLLENALKTNPAETLQHLFGNTPDVWNENLTGADRLRCIVNYLTRMRYCHADGRLEFKFKLKPSEKPATLTPWFNMPNRQDTDWSIVFGHWAALQGHTGLPNIHALDTGCAWGECLTAYCLETGVRTSVGCRPDALFAAGNGAL